MEKVEVECEAKRLADMQEKLNKAFNILHELVNIHDCAWAQSLPTGQSCKEYETNIQGVPMNGCYVCRAKELLDND